MKTVFKTGAILALQALVAGAAARADATNDFWGIGYNVFDALTSQHQGFFDYYPDQREQSYIWLTNAGMRFHRLSCSDERTVGWKHAQETGATNFDWTVWDIAVGKAQATGVKILAGVGNTVPNWANSNNRATNNAERTFIAPYPGREWSVVPDDLFPPGEWYNLSSTINTNSSWYQYANRFAERYDGDGHEDMPGLTAAGAIKHWEIWEEPLLLKHDGVSYKAWQFAGDVREYVQTLRVARAAILAADPNAKILGPCGWIPGHGSGGTTHWSWADFVSYGGRDLVDIVTWDWFPYFAYGGANPGAGNYYAWDADGTIDTALNNAEANTGGKPNWLIAIGFHEGTNSLYHLAKPRNYVRSTIIAWSRSKYGDTTPFMQRWMFAGVCDTMMEGTTAGYNEPDPYADNLSYNWGLLYSRSGSFAQGREYDPYLRPAYLAQDVMARVLKDYGNMHQPTDLSTGNARIYKFDNGANPVWVFWDKRSPATPNGNLQTTITIDTGGANKKIIGMFGEDLGTYTHLANIDAESSPKYLVGTGVAWNENLCRIAGRIWQENRSGDSWQGWYNGIGNITVQAVGPSGTRTAVTDKFGGYVITNLQQGTYTVSIPAYAQAVPTRQGPGASKADWSVPWMSDDGSQYTVGVYRTNMWGSCSFKIPVQIQVSTTNISVPSGGTTSLLARLTVPPAQNTTVAVSRVSGATNIMVQPPTSMIFSNATGTNWQTIVLSAAADSALGTSSVIRCASASMSNHNITATIVAGNANVTPTNATHTLGTTNNLPCTLLRNGRTLTRITNSVNGGTLALDADYTAAGSLYTILASCLNTQPVGNVTFTFEMNDGADPITTVSVLAGDATVSPTNAWHTRGTTNNLAMRLTPNGRSLTQILSTGTGSPLVLNTDYTVSNGTNIFIRADYLNAQASDNITLTFDMDGGLDPTAAVTISLGNASVSPTTAAHTLGTTTNLDITLSPNGRNLVHINSSGSGSPLVLNTDYTVSGDVYTILASYLNRQAVGNMTLTFDMDGGTDPTTVVTVSAGNATVSPTAAVHTIGSAANLPITLTLNGRSFIRILSTGSGSPLALNTDYTVSGTTNFTILASYLNRQAIGDVTLTFDMSGGTDPTTVATIAGGNASVSPASANHTLGSTANLAFRLTLNGQTLTQITSNGAGSPLVPNTDYTVSSGTNVTILASYLNRQSPGNVTLTFDMSGGTDPTAAITVSAGNAAVSPTTAAHTLGAGGDLAVTLTPNGRTLTQINSTGSGSPLVLNTDYTVAGNVYTILAAYLNRQSPGAVTLTFDMNGGTDPTTAITVSAGNATVSPSSATHTLGAGGNLAITLSPNGRTLTRIARSGSPLIAGADYTVAGNVYTILAAYLNRQSPGTVTLTFDMDAGTDPTTAITVSAGNASVSPSSATHTLGAGGDLVATIAPNGRTLSQITSTGTGSPLARGWDYTVSGNTYTITTTYLNSQAPGGVTLTFDMDGGSDPAIALTVYPGNASASPATAYYRMICPTNLAFTLAPNGRGFTRILSSGTSSPLVLNADYTVAGNVYTVLSAYLHQQAFGTLTLTFDMDGGTDPAAAVLVSDGNAEVWPTNAYHSLGSAANLALALDPDGWAVNQIAANGSPLVLNTDYTSAGDVYTIVASYLNSRPLGVTTLTFDMEMGADPAVAVKVWALFTGTNQAIIAENETPSTAKGSHFGIIDARESITNIFGITNVFASPLAINSLNISGDGASKFSILSAPVSVAPGAVSNLAVRFTPGERASFSARLDASVSAAGWNGTARIDLAGSGGSGLIALEPTNMTFTAARDGAEPAPRRLVLMNNGPVKYAYTLASNRPWLTVSNASGGASGVIEPDGSAIVTVRASPSGLDVGTHAAAITILAPAAANSPMNMPVVFNVGKTGQAITSFTPADKSMFLITDRPTLRASASSGLPVSFAVRAGPGRIEADGRTLSFTGQGIVSVAAIQAGDGVWSPAPEDTHAFSARKLHVPNDCDGDGLSDFLVFDSSTGCWYAAALSGEILVWAFPLGQPGAIPVPGDYNGDGRCDPAVFDPASGLWYAMTFDGAILAWEFAWGWPGMIPVPGDYNGDGRCDPAVFDPASGLWYAASFDGEILTAGFPWGWPGAMPVPGDYNGRLDCDRGVKNDPAVFDHASGLWYVRALDGEIVTWAFPWGWPGALPVPGDYDGDGKNDFTLFDRYTGLWFAINLDGEVLAWALPWGWPGAVPVPGDYDGDRRSDFAVFDQNTGLWYVAALQETEGSGVGVQEEQSLNTEHCTLNTGSARVIAWAFPWGWPGATPAGGVR